MTRGLTPAERAILAKIGRKGGMARVPKGFAAPAVKAKAVATQKKRRENSPQIIEKLGDIPDAERSE